LRAIKLSNPAIVQDHNPSTVHDGVEAVGDRDHGAVNKRFSDRSLYEVVCGVVDSGRRLVQHQDPALA